MANEFVLAKIILMIILSYEFQGFGEGTLWETMISCLTGQSPGNVEIVMRVSTESTARQWTANLKDTIDVYALQGGRPNMEDRYAIKVQGDNMAFAVFDGHGGKEMAEHASEHLLQAVIHAVKEEATRDDEAIKTKISQAVVQFNDNARLLIPHSGSTVVLGVVHGGKLYIANAGDSRAVAIQSGGSVSPITIDHHVTNPDEIQRVGQENIWEDVSGRNRLAGVSMVTRSLGDYNCEKNRLTATPELFTIDLEGPTKYIILATDGVWEKLNNNEAGEIILSNTKKSSKGTPFGAEQLVNEAERKGSTDNITAMVVKIAAIRTWLENNARRGKKC